MQETGVPAAVSGKVTRHVELGSAACPALTLLTSHMLSFTGCALRGSCKSLAWLLIFWAKGVILCPLASSLQAFSFASTMSSDSCLVVADMMANGGKLLVDNNLDLSISERLPFRSTY